MVLMLASAALLFFADWAVKKYILQLHKDHRLPKNFCGGRVRIRLLKNPGLMCGLGAKRPTLAKWLPVGAMIGFLWLAPKVLSLQTVLSRLGFGLVLGGGLNNTCDRLKNGAVTDYVQFPKVPKIRPLHFNLSDFGLFLGLLFLLFDK